MLLSTCKYNNNELENKTCGKMSLLPIDTHVDLDSMDQAQENSSYSKSGELNQLRFCKTSHSCNYCGARPYRW